MNPQHSAHGWAWAIAVAFLSLLAHATVVQACEIKVEVKGTPRETYARGDVVILKVNVFFTHRNCPEGIKSTKFTGVGMKILGATKWKQISPGKFVRLLKVEITEAEKGEGALHVRRTCDKEGGYAVLKLHVPAAPPAAESADGPADEPADERAGDHAGAPTDHHADEQLDDRAAQAAEERGA